MRVKICGITNIDDALFCSSQGANALGFIFYNKSKRYIPSNSAGEIIKELPAFVFKVGVFVNETPETVNKIASEIGLNAVQLHGDESPEYISGIKYPVIKSFRVGDNFNWLQLSDYENCNILLDTFSITEMGGTGKSFDWKSIPENIKTKIILSGGINTGKLEYILKEIKPAAVDLSSSLESSPGKKDKTKVVEFFAKYNELRNTKNNK